MPDFVAPMREIRDLLAGLDGMADPLGRGGQPVHRSGNGAGENQGQKNRYDDGHAEDTQHSDPFGIQNRIDIAATGGQKQHPHDRAVAPHRDCHTNQQFAMFVNPDHRALGSGHGRRNFGIGALGIGAEFLIKRQIAPAQPNQESAPGRFHPAFFIGIDRRQFISQDLAAGIKVLGIEDQQAVFIVDPGTRAGGKDQMSQDRRHPCRVDREFEGFEFVFERRDALAGFEVEKALRIDGNGIDIDRGGGRNGGGDNFALGQERLDPGVDQSFTELIHEKNTGQQTDQSHQVENQNAAGQ